VWHGCGTSPARAARQTCRAVRDRVLTWARDGAGEGNRTLMTSLEGGPRMAVVGLGLRVRVAGGDRD
jgi:hypothetical protein